MPSTFYAFVLQSFVLLPAHELRGLPQWALSLPNLGLWVHSWLVVPTKQKGKGFHLSDHTPLKENEFTGSCQPGNCGRHRPNDVRENTNSSFRVFLQTQEGRLLLLFVEPWHPAGAEPSWF